ncbi:MAG: GTPase HflX [Spirochaetales bacterium]|nr:GTPase HflX [Spirochaetales bacterium]
MDNIFVELEARDILSLKCERALLIEIQESDESLTEAESHLEELSSLVMTMGIPAVESIIVKPREKKPGWLLGKGKIEELADLADSVEADVLVFDTELTPTQQRNLERQFNLCVIDRQEVILDIFADRASTREATLQVALARMEYSLPRLTRAWTHLSRQRGGAKGTRGKGETQLETDRRMVQARISKLKKELDKVKQTRHLQRKKRSERPVPSIAIVGYTNAGKSSLLNGITGSDVLVEDKLFATLDPTSRRLKMEGGREVILTDTVGFVRKLPHNLVDAFHSTLEEAVLADLILHVVDGSSDEYQSHIDTTREVLQELGAADVPRLLVFNKIDLPAGEANRQVQEFAYPEALYISVHGELGLEKLEEEISTRLDQLQQLTTLLIPSDRWDLVALLHRTSTVSSEEYVDDGVLLEVWLGEKDRNQFARFIQSGA